MTTLHTPWTSGSGRRRTRPAVLVAAASSAAVAVFVVASGLASGDGWGLHAPGGGDAVPVDEPADDEPALDDPGLDDPDPVAEPREVPPSEPPPATEEPSRERAPEVDDPAEPPAATDPAVEPPAAEPPAEDASEDEPAPVDVAAVQHRLRELGYLLGAADGVAGQQTLGAVMAFQAVNGLAVDGVIGPRTLAALEAPVEPELRGGPATRIEVDLDRQVLHVVEDGQRVVTLKASSGNGAPYTSSYGTPARARTPVGEFVVERRIHGVRQSALGTLYDPLYFHRGFAIHGSTSVPAREASHGCVRIPMADARWLIDRIPDGTPVHLHGGTHVFWPANAG